MTLSVGQNSKRYIHLFNCLVNLTGTHLPKCLVISDSCSDFPKVKKKNVRHSVRQNIMIRLTETYETRKKLKHLFL